MGKNFHLFKLFSWNSVKQKDGKNQERASKYYTVITKKGF